MAGMYDGSANAYNTVWERIAAGARPARTASKTLLDVGCSVFGVFADVEGLGVVVIPRGNCA